jgi:hypothetical protein
MSNKSRFIDIHEQARSYQRVKSKHILEYLYSDFVDWHKIPDFHNKITAPSGRIIEFIDDPAVLIGTARLKATTNVWPL